MSNKSLNQKIFEARVDANLYAEIFSRLPSGAPQETFDGAQAGVSLMLALLNAVQTTNPELTGEQLMAEVVRIAVHINRAAQDHKQAAFPLYVMEIDGR
jgi:hypothetical protein